MQEQNVVQMPAPKPSTDIALLPPPERAAIVLKSEKAEAELRALIEKSAVITTVKDAAGRAEAHRAAMDLKNARIAIKNAAELARDDANQFSKAVVAEEKRLIAIVTAEEARVFGIRDAYDAKAKAEKEEAERKERDRVQGIKAQIAGILNLPATSYRDSADQLEETLTDLAALEITEATFAEFAGDAADAKATAMAGLRELLAAARAAEAEAARLEEERAELQRIQAAEAEKRRAAEAEAKRLADEQAETQRKLEAALAELAQHRAAAQQPRMWSPEPAPAEQAEAVYETAIAADEAEVSETLTATEVPFEAEFSSRPDCIVRGPADPDADLKDGIAILCAAVQALRTMGMSNETILVTVGEALEAIDAKEAA